MKSRIRRGIASVSTARPIGELRLGWAEALVRRQHLGPLAKKFLVTLDDRLGQLAVGFLFS